MSDEDKIKSIVQSFHQLQVEEGDVKEIPK